MNELDPTFLGTVSAVSGATVAVRLAASLTSGLAIIDGHTYRVGQVGSFVRIPQGYQSLYGVVSDVGATAAPANLKVSEEDAGRWMNIQLAGESIGDRFERGISQHPNIGDSVHLVTESDLRRIYGGGGEKHVSIGCLSSAENVDVRLSIDALVTRHSAIVGSTGSGKSTTVASILRSIVTPGERTGGLPNSRVLLLDIHGEYTAALGDIARVFSATPRPGEQALHVPYWALEAGELLSFVAGDLSEAHETAFNDKLLELKHASLQMAARAGLLPTSMTVDSPVPFSLKRLWFELVDFELTTFVGKDRDQPAREEDGDVDTLVPPKYTPHAMGSAGPFLNAAAKGIKRPLNLIRSRLLDRRYDFILHPGRWEPDSNGAVAADLDSLLQGWLGHDRQVTILDLSGVPSTVLVRLIGSILRIIYEALFWSREKTEGGVLRPLLVVMEEAHRYLNPSDENVAATMVKRIAKEGRKYGIGAMLVSQRPAEIDETVLSQCGTIIALRLSNPTDRARVKGTLPDNLAGLMDLLPVLRTGEAIVAGEAARLPVRCMVRLPPDRHVPQSSDPAVADSWTTRRISEGYDRVVASWRAQSTIAVSATIAIVRQTIVVEEPLPGQDMDRDAVSSSTVASVGYDEPSQTLEVEFLNGTIYQYFNVGSALHEAFMTSASKGQFLSQSIRASYPYTRVA